MTEPPSTVARVLDRALADDPDRAALVTASGPLAYLELDVSAHGATPRRVRTGNWVARGTLAALVPGTTLDVRVDPADPDRVAVDWARTLPRLQQPAGSAAGGPLTIVV